MTILAVPDSKQLFLSAHWPTVTALVCLALLIVSYTAVNSIAKSRKGSLPPGPPGVFFFGNLFQLTVDVWVKFTEWKYTYGDLVYITVAGQGIAILNSHKVAADLLDRRAAIYSSRPRLIVASEILTGGYLIPFTPHTDLWRKMRRASHEGLNASTAKAYYPAQQRESASLVQGMLKDPSNWDNELKRAATSMILGVVYDKPAIESCLDPSISYSNEFIARIVRAAFPGAHYAEYFTWMKHLPASIAKWKRDALEWYHRDSEYFGQMYNEVKVRVDDGDDRPSFTSSLVKDERNLGLNVAESSWLAATIYATGGETTSTVMAWFMLAMVHFPEVQKRAQAELDAVVGRDRMPTFEDRESLPYIQGCVRETLRWRTAAPVGVPHYSTEDDVYGGHFIPKGTIMIANQWSMNRDPEVYGDDVHLFKPERYMDNEGNVAPLPPALADTKDEGHVGYGFGRRICVGRHVANNSIFIDIAALLWGTVIEPVKDSAGKPIMPDTEGFINDGLVIRPIPFKCNVRPRFSDVHNIVSETRESYQ